jgi:hypothetical protein
MDRSRADDILREWSAVASNARRPLSAPRRRMTRTALPVGLLAAAVLALAAVLVFSLLYRGNQTVGPSPSSSPGLTASPSELASPTPSLTPEATPAVRDATVVASIPNCENPLRWSYAISGNDLYIICYGSNVPDSDSFPYIARADLTTGKVKATYGTDLVMTYAYTVAVADGNLWYDVTLGSACIPPGCDGFHRLERFDVATGKRTLDLPNVELEGSAFGYLWVRDLSPANPNSKGQLVKLDPKTGQKKGAIPFDMDRVELACGSLWGLTTSDGTTANEKTTVARIDPADGSILASFTEPGWLFAPQSVGSECWARARCSTDSWPGYDYPDQLVRIGQSGIEDRSPSFAPANQGGTAQPYVAILDGTFWLVSQPADFADQVTVTLQRLDSSTWEPSGPTWRCVATGYPGDALAGIDGSIWTYDNDSGVARLDIPLGS